MNKQNYSYLLDAYKELAQAYHLLAQIASGHTGHIEHTYSYCNEQTCMMHRRVLEHINEMSLVRE